VLCFAICPLRGATVSCVLQRALIAITDYALSKIYTRLPYGTIYGKTQRFLGIKGEVDWVLALLIWAWMRQKMWCVRYTAIAQCWPSLYYDSLNLINSGVTICTTFFNVQELYTLAAYAVACSGQFLSLRLPR
jgi:hypothetical protein